MLRIEAGLVFAGYEFCDQIDPFEAGIGFTVPLQWATRTSSAVKRCSGGTSTRSGSWSDLEMEGDETVGHGDCVHIGRAQVGVITSAARSPILKKNIALCRVDVTNAALGTEVEVGKLDGQQKRLPARIVRFPHYDPDKSRVRA